jgi:hypothetical protein
VTLSPLDSHCSGYIQQSNPPTQLRSPDDADSDTGR